MGHDVFQGDAVVVVEDVVVVVVVVLVVVVVVVASFLVNSRVAEVQAGQRFPLEKELGSSQPGSLYGWKEEK